MKNGKIVLNENVIMFFTRRAYLISLGIMLILDGIFFFLLNLNVFKKGLSSLWPVLVIITGFSFFLVDFFMMRKIRTIFLFPSILLVLLGTLFLVFSLGVVPFSFRKFMTLLGPVLLVFCGVGIIVVYGFQKFNKENFPFMDEDSSGEDAFC
jgi:hypothetical protein